MASIGVFVTCRQGISNQLTSHICLDLVAHGIDVFADVVTRSPAEFQAVVLKQIAARPVFVVVLLPGTLEGCALQDDPLFETIRYAIQTSRRIIPVHVPEFDHSDVDRLLPAGIAAALRRTPFFQLASTPPSFDQGMTLLRELIVKPVDLPVLTIPAEQQAAPTVDLHQQQAEYMASPYLDRGRLKYLEGNLDAAAYAFSQAIEIYPDYAEAYLNRGTLLHVKGDLRGAIRDYSQAIRLMPTHADSYRSRATAYAALGEMTRATADYDRALALNPQDKESLYERGLLRLKLGDLDAAYDDLNTLLSLVPHHVGARFNRAVLFRIRGDLESALADLNEVLELQPAAEDAYYLRGKIADELGYPQVAAQDFQHVLDLRPNFYDAERLLAYIDAHFQQA